MIDCPAGVVIDPIMLLAGCVLLLVFGGCLGAIGAALAAAAGRW